MVKSTEPAPYAPINGVRLAAAAAGIRYEGRDDLALIELGADARCAGVFTQNAFCAAPVVVTREHLAAGAPRYLLINAGNANAGTGARGLADARASCAALAAAVGCTPAAVLPFSTGVIGEHLPVERLAAALPGLVADLDANGWPRAARAIMTTDTVMKLASRTFELDGRTGTVTGMAKGAGMIRPDMATLLSFVATDAAIDQPLLERCIRDVTNETFNAITVDGDTSTNDSCMLIASGALGNRSLSDPASAAYRSVYAAIEGVCADLARAIVRDGEGATKLVEIRVEEAASPAEARAVADTIAHSPLVKTALFASDPNWGRVLAAIGRAGVPGLDIAGVRLWLDGVLIASGGARDPAYEEAAGQAVMAKPEFAIRVALGRGDASARVLTCDLSYDYVRINAEYRT